MAIYLYQSKKVQRYAGAKVYDDRASPARDIDPLMIWYMDVFFLNRERHLVIANPLTKFTFFILRYARKTHPVFLNSFTTALKETINACDIDPSNYLRECDQLLPYEETNRSASAHLSRIKEDYGWMMYDGYFDINLAEQQTFMNHHVTTYLTTYHKTDYDYPKQRFYHELLLRRWA